MIPSREARRHPMQIGVLRACAVGGLALLVSGAQPGSMTALLPAAFVHAWGGVLFAAGVAGSVAAAMRDPIVAILVERVALLGFAGATLIYTVAIIASIGMSGLVPAAFFGFLCFAAVQRARQINRDIKRVREIAARAET